jgi:peptide/nickel transport system permease protein
MGELHSIQVIETENEEIIIENRQFNILGIIQVIVSIVSLIFGGLIILGGITIFIQNLIGIPTIAPLYINLWGLQALIALVFGYIMIRIGTSIMDLDEWAFQAALYMNILLAIVFLSIGSLGILLALLPLAPILLLFQPKVKPYWYPNFREDMSPRIKELKYSLYLVRRSPLVTGGIVIIVVFVILAFMAPFIAPYGPEERIWADNNLSPGSPSSIPDKPIHYFGTDDSGGDILSRVLYAAAVDLRVSFTIVAVALTFGTLIGAASGYFGGKFDELIMRITDVFFAFPGLILAMAIVMAMGGRSLDNISIALMVTWWPTYARLVRGQVLAEREKLYVEAARSIGASDTRILLYHIIPNTIQPLIVQATMDTGSVLLVAAGLAFIGFGPPAGIAEWGLMIAIGQLYFMMNPWAVFFPGLAILFSALAFNLVGDGIRDILDPKLRRR